MEIPTLAAGLAGYLAPFIPYLVTGGEKAMEEASKRLGGAVLDQAVRIWERLRGVLSRDSLALETLARDPADADALAALRLQLKQVLGADPELTKELAGLLDQAHSMQANVAHVEGHHNVVVQGEGAVAAGSGGIAIGGNVRNSVVQTGDGPKRRSPPGRAGGK